MSLSKSREYLILSSDEENQQDDATRLASWRGSTSNGTVSRLLQILGYVALFGLGALFGTQFAPTDATHQASIYTRRNPFQAWFKELRTRFDKVVTFEGTLDAPSPYRGPPSDDIDRAWNWTTHVGPVDLGVDESDLESLGLDAETVARYPDGVYMVEFEFSHQLHCLNLLRMASHMDYYQSRRIDFRESPGMVRTHLDHCVEMLRQTLMCHADSNLFPSQWVKGRSVPYPNFNVRHTCRDFNSILQYSLDHRVQDNGVLLSKPPGAKELDTEP
ncbi:MAG: hypothetical protein MMC23_007993 [Stictis urceolatum]|nr:hypothetical protein [Stictis urceolata]